MVKKLTLADGSEVEVPTDEELKELQTKATAHDDLQTKVTTLTKDKEEYEKDSSNKNWQEAREKIKRLETGLKESGKEVDDQGNIIEKPTQLTNEEIEAKATGAATAVILDQRKTTLLKKYDDEQRKVVEHYYDKLSTGEEKNIDNVDKFIAEAERLSTPNSKDMSPSINGGQPPLLRNNDSKFTETDAGKAIYDEINNPAPNIPKPLVPPVPPAPPAV